MSNTVINWRFWAYHLQVLQWRDWSWRGWRGGDRIIRWSRNDYWGKGGPGRCSADWTPVAFYEGRRYLAVPAALIALLVWSLI